MLSDLNIRKKPSKVPSRLVTRKPSTFGQFKRTGLQTLFTFYFYHFELDGGGISMEIEKFKFWTTFNF